MSLIRSGKSRGDPVSTDRNRTVQLSRARRCLLLAGAITGALLAASPAANGQGRAPSSDSQAQIGISIDARRNQAFIKEDDGELSFVYSATRNGDVLLVQPASKDLMAIWKEGALINPSLDIESKGQFAPAFLVADIRNDTASPLTVTNAYLDVSESRTDYQPYLSGPGQSACDSGSGEGSYSPTIGIANYGWGPVLRPKFTYTFNAGRVQSKPFVTLAPTFDKSLEASFEGALKQAGANVAAMKRNNFACASRSNVPACFARLKQSHVLGDLGNSMYVEPDGDTIYSEVKGSIDYTWTEDKGRTNNSKGSFSVTVPLGRFAVGGGAECGGSGPMDRTEHPIVLPLDRQHYRIPLNWHARMLSRQEQKFALSLASLKSSHHQLKVVLQLSDGRTISSPVIDLTYFIPRLE